MPIIKTPDGAAQPQYFKITRVEVVKFGDEFAWLAHYHAWDSPEQARQPDAKPRTGMVDTGVPLTLAPDVFEAYERTAIITPSSHFFGGEIIDEVSQYTPVELARVSQWAAVKAQRDAYRASGIDTPYGRFDSDLESIVNLIGAATIASQMPETWSDQWILKDRSTITLTRAQLMEVGAIAADFRGRTYRRGDELYKAIQQAETVEAVRAITWSPGVA